MADEQALLDSEFISILREFTDDQRRSLIWVCNDHFCLRCGKWYEVPGVKESCSCFIIVRHPRLDGSPKEPK